MLEPQATIDQPQLKRGLGVLTVEVVFSATCDAMMTGVILTAFALQKGATEAQIGLLASVAFWAQLLQGPGVLLVERLRRRKAIAVVGSLVSSLAPAMMAALAFAAATQGARIGLVFAVALYCGAGAFAGCAWNAWTRDLVPEGSRGRFFARRSRLAMTTSVVVGLLAAAALDWAGEGTTAQAVTFAGLFALAVVAQLLSAAGLARVPEPQMPPAEAPPRLVALIRRPLRDPSFRPLIRFSASWQFAVNLAQPFFTVFMLQQLGFGVATVMGLTVTSQVANVWALKRWGALGDRYGFKSVLNVAAPAFLLCVAGMIGASQFGDRGSAVIYLAVLHVIMGAASAGVSLASGSIAQKLSPQGAAAAYLSANGLISSAVAGLAPILGGLGAYFFSVREFALLMEWTGPRIRGEMLGLRLSGWDFYFGLSALCGLYALHRLAMVHEEGELGRRDMTQAILARARGRFGRPPAVAGAAPPEELSDALAEGAEDAGEAGRP